MLLPNEAGVAVIEYVFVINVYPATVTYNMNVTLYSILNFITITTLVKVCV